MARIFHYNNIGAVLNNQPRIIPQRRSRRQNPHLRKEPIVDKGLALNQRPRIESMVVSFDLPPGIKISNPFPPEIFVPGQTIFMAGAITTEVGKVVSQEIISKGLKNPRKPILLWIDSPGGETGAGKLIRAAIQVVRPRVSTIAMGAVSSMAAFLTAFGRNGYRYALEDTTLMYHEVRYSDELEGGAEELMADSQHLTASTEELLAMLAEASGNKMGLLREAIRKSDRYFSALEANRAGFIDGVIKHQRYGGVADPRGLKIQSYNKNPIQKGNERVLALKDGIPSLGKPYTITLKGFLNAMRTYKLIAQLVSHITIEPAKDVRLKIRNSQGGVVEEALGVFDVMRLINALPNTGDIVTFGGGRKVSGVSALLLAAGKKGKRRLQASTRMVLKDVENYVPAHAPSSEVEDISRETLRVKDLVLDRLGKHSDLSPEAIRSALSEGEGEFVMDANQALADKFVDEVIETGPRK